MKYVGVFYDPKREVPYCRRVGETKDVDLVPVDEVAVGFTLEEVVKYREDIKKMALQLLHYGTNLAVALHSRDPYIQSLIQQHSEGNEEKGKMIATKAWERNEGGSKDFYLKLAADVIADMEEGNE